ncbi:acyl-CoA dehydrogenase family protein [Methylobacterium isbiliense]|jgi:alkylation response protein AidB-like acyl-CoA dehydrogenase|uniref:FMNH2-dependent monooxygenase SfnC n=1 Tax=Methylobacterium isbiliense TaxID=315478 RepID=A0ABQ4SDE1_9HYPH|nr:acyl-CoA dehydrogenase family protein [Methylobacterium isbiliense]MDN3626741.1 acyl-CoA dehydrogenase family protein [Methylobacterium isbiliense]GJE01241.1 putative FMNH2-dependent monooxygenase SfnC [Methylobacterium isbiliense]
MSQTQAGWGGGPSARYEDFAERFRPVFRRIRETAPARDRDRRLPHEEIAWLREAGFTTLRLPRAQNGHDATLPELFNLLIELSAADSNVTNALRAHFGFTEDALNSRFPAWREAWLARIARGETVGSGVSESGSAKVGSFDTVLRRDGAGWRLDGTKYYTTGSLFADWIHLAAEDEAGAPVGAAVPRRAPGVEVVDDWDGFGQALTASGTVRFTDVALSADLVNPDPGRFRYAMAFFQLVHLATLAGIARAAAEDVARLVGERRRVYSHGNAATVAEDPQVLQVVGRVRGAAYAAGAVALKNAEALQRVYAADQAGDAETAEAAGRVADVEVNQSVTVVTSLVLDATTLLFDALGASATARTLGLDRYWRNARTIASHNPRIYRDRIVGDFAVNGATPPKQYRVGQG